jgi:hypothetical protein
MLSKQLADILTDLCRASDVTVDRSIDMDRRFVSLRGYGRLPRGRENRSRPLTDKQIVAALFGLVATQPGWAGHVAAILERLQPVGGKTEAFGGAATITDALSHLLLDANARQTLIAVRLSVAESGANSHGLAVITYDRDGGRHELAFVRAEAVSLLQLGVQFDAALRNAPASRELVLNRGFFDRLARKIEESRLRPVPPIGNGSEYDGEDAEEERRKRLGATGSSHFLNIGVDNQVTWPRKEMLIEFDRYKLVLMPKTNEHVQSIHVDLHANRLSMEEALTIINRFLSLMTWCDDGYAIAQDGWSGNPVPVAVPRRNLAFTTTYQWIFHRQIPTSDEARRALALYREARNAEQNFMISYAVLSYFKVLEVRYPDGKDIRPWIAKTYPLLSVGSDEMRLNALLVARAESVEEYLWTACRVAVAHVSARAPSDPDSAAELNRLHHAAGVMRRLARYFIREVLGVSESRFDDSIALTT